MIKEPKVLHDLNKYRFLSYRYLSTAGNVLSKTRVPGALPQPSLLRAAIRPQIQAQPLRIEKTSVELISNYF